MPRMTSPIPNPAQALARTRTSTTADVCTIPAGLQTVPIGPSEAAFQAAVIELARLLGWRCFHTFDSRRSTAGWPDLVLCKPPRLLVAELKSARGRVRAEQRDWLAALGACPGVEAVLWRPGDWVEIEALLIGGGQMGGER